ncbi:MAG: zinc ribbon domain-containing protein [candidate division WOR-3 bacterium]|jgi:predicted nucleic acid-binding Zn ribbon protein
MRCPHCGEPVAPGQERCFACGEKIRAGGFRRKTTPFDSRIIIISAVLLVIALTGVLGVVLSSRKKSPGTGKPVRSTRQLTDSLRRRPVPDTTRLPIADDDISRLRERLAKVQIRYDKVKSQVLGETPTPEQRNLMSQIQRELGVLNSKLSELGSGVSVSRKGQLLTEFTDAERRLNNLISRFSRAPKNR